MRIKKNIAIFFFVLITSATFSGCTNSKTNANNRLEHEQNETSHVIEKNRNSFEINKEDKKESNTETLDYIQQAIDSSALVENNFIIDEGNIFFTRYSFDVSYRGYAYAYWNKNIKRIFDTGNNVFAIMDDGSLYNGSTLVTDNYQIKNAVHINYNGTFFITEDGKVLRYKSNKELDFPQIVYTIEELDGSKITVGVEEKYSLVVFDESGNLYGVGIGADKLYPRKNSILYGKCDVKDWKNLVLIDGFWDENNDIACIAGISEDGKTYASGDYADEILSWGELKYISMDNNLIVGVKKDGTLAFAGEYSDKFREFNLNHIDAAKIEGYNFMAVTQEGLYFCDFYTNQEEEYKDFELNFFDKKIDYDGWNHGYGIIDNEGHIYDEYDKFDDKIRLDYDFQGNSIKDKDFAKFSFSKKLSTINSEINWGTNRKGRNYNAYMVKEMDFCLVDIDNDGIHELLLRDETAPHSDGYVGLAVIYNAYPRVILTDDDISGYYQDTGVVVTDRSNKGYVQRRYWKKEEGYINPICYTYTDMNSENITTKYFVYKSFANEVGATIPDGTGDDDGIEITENQFKKLEEKYFSSEMTSVSYDDFIENNAKNRLEYILGKDM